VNPRLAGPGPNPVGPRRQKPASAQGSRFVAVHQCTVLRLKRTFVRSGRILWAVTLESSAMGNPGQPTTSFRILPAAGRRNSTLCKATIDSHFEWPPSRATPGSILDRRAAEGKTSSHLLPKASPSSDIVHRQTATTKGKGTERHRRANRGIPRHERPVAIFPPRSDHAGFLRLISQSTPAPSAQLKTDSRSSPFVSREVVQHASDIRDGVPMANPRKHRGHPG